MIFQCGPKYAVGDDEPEDKVEASQETAPLTSATEVTNNSSSPHDIGIQGGDPLTDVKEIEGSLGHQQDYLKC